MVLYFLGKNTTKGLCVYPENTVDLRIFYGIVPFTSIAKLGSIY